MNLFSLTPVAGADLVGWLQASGSSILTVILIIAGLSLIIRSFLDIRGALGSENKEWGKAAIGLVVGIVGAVFLWWSASGAMSFLQSKRDVIPTD